MEFMDGKIITFYLGLTDWCNLYCWMCPQRDFYKHKKTRGFLSLRGLKKILSPDLKKILSPQSHIFLMWLGESTLYPYWSELLSYLSFFNKNFSKVVLYTNGTNLQPLRQLLSYLDSFKIQLIFSLDSFQKETYLSIKGLPLLKRVEKNIQELLEVYGKHPNLELSVQFLVMEQNYKEAARFKNKWATIFSSYNLPYGVVSDYSLQDYSLHRLNIVFRRTTMQNMEYATQLYLKTLKKMDLLPHERYIQNKSDSNIEKSSVHINEKQAKRICPAPFRNLTINWDGEVTFCCYDSYLEIKLGNIFEKTLPEIWYGEKAQQIRRAFLKNKLQDLPNICKKCFTFDAPDLTVEEMEIWSQMV
jgi:radical SAM protein with 4Fe4S-binding SPASM domain